MPACCIVKQMSDPGLAGLPLIAREIGFMTGSCEPIQSAALQGKIVVCEAIEETMVLGIGCRLCQFAVRGGVVVHYETETQFR